jgi:uncharacterized protein (DUF4213/DUF364 family)
MGIFETLLPLLPEGRVVQVQVGLYWTGVVVEVEGDLRCGLAATLHNPSVEHARVPAVSAPGTLEALPACQVAELVHSQSVTETSIGLAALNALLPAPPNLDNLPAEDYIARQGSHSRVALVGHFPFVADLRARVRDLWVLELNPTAGDLPASAAQQVIPQADILAITATTLINHTFDGLMALRRPDARVLLLGPSTPLSPALFDLGISVLSGTVVEDIERVMGLIRHAATFRQIKGSGVRLVTMESGTRGMRQI